MTAFRKRCLMLVLLWVGAHASPNAALAGDVLDSHPSDFPSGDVELHSLLGPHFLNAQSRSPNGAQNDGDFTISLLDADAQFARDTLLPEAEFTPVYSAMPPAPGLPPDMIRQDVVNAISNGQSVSQERDFRLLPDGLMWHSYLAGPQEPRFSILLLGDDKDGFYWDSTLGGRVGFLRYGTEGAKDPQGWQWDFEGAVVTRLNLLEQEDVESMDYRFGTQMTWAEGPWAMKFGYYHISSHVGDEYLLRNPTFERVNYVTESLVWGLSNKPIEPLRVYGESAFAMKSSGGAKRWQFQTGAEWTHPRSQPKALAPFAAANLAFRETTNYHMSTTLQTGWYYQGPDSNRRLRFGLQYGKGPTSQFEFYTKNEEYIGWGIWFDF